MTSPIPLDLQLKLTDWRRKAAEGTLTLDEMKDAVKLLRAGRVAAANASDTARRKVAKAVIPSADELLDEI
jgi:SpoU rRNA methylase family enzyme